MNVKSRKERNARLAADLQASTALSAVIEIDWRDWGFGWAPGIVSIGPMDIQWDSKPWVKRVWLTRLGTIYLLKGMMFGVCVNSDFMSLDLGCISFEVGR